MVDIYRFQSELAAMSYLESHVFGICQLSEKSCLDRDEMPDEKELQPTIENPFSDNPGNSDTTRTYAPRLTPEAVSRVDRRVESANGQPFARTPARDNNTIRTTAPTGPGFYLSKASERMLDAANLSEEETVEVLAVSKAVGDAFGRKAPSISDVEVSISIKTFERLRGIADGSVEFDYIYGKAKEPLGKPQRLKYWRQMATYAVQLLDQV